MVAYSRKLRAARAWDSALNAKDFNWWDAPQIIAHYNKQVCGTQIPNDNAAGCRERLRQKWPGRRFGHAISIGCGMGKKESALVEAGLVDHFDLYDISDLTVLEAKKEIARRKREDQLTFLPNDPAKDWSCRYDLVYWDHALHHMFDVAMYVAWSKSVLRENGVFLLNDYVGPNRLQWTKFNILSCRQLLGNFDMNGAVQPLRNCNLISRLRQYIRDPSEAAKSEDIIPSCNAHFPNLEFRPIGGFIYLTLGNRLRYFASSNESLATITAADDLFRRSGYYHYAFALWEKR